MKPHSFVPALAVALFTFAAGSLHAQQSEWGKPIPPLRIAGPLYYVGTAQVTSLLIATPQGHILIDGAYPESAAQILDNVRMLGFKPEDIRVLLSSHAHADHAGGLAGLKAKTGARLYAGKDDVAPLARGGKGDFAFGDSLTFPAVKADVALKDGQKVTLGGVAVRAIATPGHTKGCTSWAFTIEDQGQPLRVVMVGGTTAPDYQLVDNARYPKIARDFERTFARLEAEPSDIFIEGHGFFFGLDEKRSGQRSFVDPEGYRASIARAEGAFRKRLEQQTAEKAKAAR